MKKFSLSLLTILFCSLSVFAQKSELSEKYAKSITNEDLYDYLSILASDALEGRETGKRGQKMAATFISTHFESLNLTAPVKNGNTKSYNQNVPLYSLSPADTYMKVKKEKYINFEEVVYYGNALTNEDISSSVVFVGKGTKANFENLDVKGKAVLAMITNLFGWRELSKIAKEKGASLLLVSVSGNDDEMFNKTVRRFKNFISRKVSLTKPDSDSNFYGIFFIAPSVASTILNKSYDKIIQIIKKDEEGKKDALTNVKNGKIIFKISQNVVPFSSENVLGYLEGSDLKDELLIVSAHYDHIGKYNTLINNGADDNGSGTSAIMELAEAFSQAKTDGNGPRRSILFMAFTGEEKGLLGSEYYTKNPVFPMEQTIVDLNIDMIGRIDTLYERNNNENYVFLVGSNRLSTELHEISENINNIYSNLILDYTFNDENHPERIYYRSDHWNFAKNNIPVIFYTDGHHRDYHKPTDTLDKINFDILKKRTQLIFHTAWELANRDNKPVVDKVTK